MNKRLLVLAKALITTAVISAGGLIAVRLNLLLATFVILATVGAVASVLCVYVIVSLIIDELSGLSQSQEKNAKRKRKEGGKESQEPPIKKLTDVGFDKN